MMIHVVLYLLMCLHIFEVLSFLDLGLQRYDWIGEIRSTNPLASQKIL